MRRNFYNLSTLTKRLLFVTGCGLFSAFAFFLTTGVGVTGLGLGVGPTEWLAITVAPCPVGASHTSPECKPWESTRKNKPAF